MCYYHQAIMMRSLLFLVVLTLTPAMAIETPAYQVLSSEGKFEIRDYPALTVIRTPMGDGDFMRLFRFISGGNKESQKIAMTAPVLTQQVGDLSGMSFVLPRTVASGRVPAPGEESVSVDVVPPARRAVFRYSGGRNQENEERALAKLRAWVDGKSLRTSGEPLFAYYDPPWIPPFFRRNEVMLTLEGE